MTAFIGQVVFEAIIAISTSLLAGGLTGLPLWVYRRSPRGGLSLVRYFVSKYNSEYPCPLADVSCYAFLAFTWPSLEVSLGPLLRILLPSIDYRYAFP